MTILQNDTRIKQSFKNISESSYDKIIFFDKKKLTEKGWLLFDAILETVFNENNHKLVVQMETQPGGIIRFASIEAIRDVINLFGDLNLWATDGTGRLSNLANGRLDYTKMSTGKNALIGKLVDTRVKNDNFTYIRSGAINLNIDTVVLDNTLFTFVRSDDGSGLKRAKIKNIEAFKFLKKYAGDYSFDVFYPKGTEVGADEVPGITVPPIIVPPVKPEQCNVAAHADYDAINKELKEWKDAFGNQKPSDITSQIANLEKENAGQKDTIVKLQELVKKQAGQIDDLEAALGIAKKDEANSQLDALQVDVGKTK